MTKNEFRFKILGELEAVKERVSLFGYIANTDEEGDLYGVQFTNDGQVTETGIRFYDDTYQFHGSAFMVNRWYSEVNTIMNSNSLDGGCLVRINHTLGTSTTMIF